MKYRPMNYTVNILMWSLILVTVRLMVRLLDGKNRGVHLESRMPVDGVLHLLYFSIQHNNNGLLQAEVKVAIQLVT